MRVPLNRKLKSNNPKARNKLLFIAFHLNLRSLPKDDKRKATYINSIIFSSAKYHATKTELSGCTCLILFIEFLLTNNSACH